jgi:hypothetical protein
VESYGLFGLGIGCHRFELRGGCLFGDFMKSRVTEGQEST